MLWSVGHGPSGGDYVNAVQPGANLGWPYITGGRDYSGAPIGVGLQNEGMTSPAHVFDRTIAPSGAVFYAGGMFKDWEGQLLAGGLAARSLVRIDTDGARVAGVNIIEVGRRVRDVKLGADGAIWLVTDHSDGELVRLQPKG